MIGDRRGGGNARVVDDERDRCRAREHQRLRVRITVGVGRDDAQPRARFEGHRVAAGRRIGGVAEPIGEKAVDRDGAAGSVAGERDGADPLEQRPHTGRAHRRQEPARGIGDERGRIDRPAEGHAAHRTALGPGQVHRLARSVEWDGVRRTEDRITRRRQERLLELELEVREQVRRIRAASARCRR